MKAKQSNPRRDQNDNKAENIKNKTLRWAFKNHFSLSFCSSLNPCHCACHGNHGDPSWRTVKKNNKHGRQHFQHGRILTSNWLWKEGRISGIKLYHKLLDYLECARNCRNIRCSVKDLFKIKERWKRQLKPIPDLN